MGTFIHCWGDYKLRTFSESNLTICGKVASAYNPQPSNRLVGIFPRKKSGISIPGERARERDRERLDMDGHSLKHWLG